MKKKTCRKCGHDKHESDFYFTRGRPRAICKACWLKGDKRRQEGVPPEVRAKHLAGERQRVKSWREKFPEYRKSQEANQRAARLGAMGRITPSDVLAAWQKWHGKCWVCGDHATQLDHVRPINKQAGGTNTADNIRPICGECNHKRSRLWFGMNKAEQEAVLLKEIKSMLHAK